MTVTKKKVASSSNSDKPRSKTPLKLVKGAKAPATKEPVKLTPGQRLAKARADKAAGIAPKKKAAPKRNPLPSWQAPSDFKPHFVEITVRTEKDGLLGTAIKAIRINGSYPFDDPSSIDDKKKYDMSAYDPATVIGIQARLAGVTFKPTKDKKYPADIKERNATEKVDGKVKLVHRTAERLPALTTFRLVFRINRKRVDGSIGPIRKQIVQAVKSPKGTIKPIVLEKTDPVYRLFSRVTAILPAAFKDVQMPPARSRKRKVEDDGDE